MQRLLHHQEKKVKVVKMQTMAVALALVVDVHLRLYVLHVLLQ